MGAPLLVIKGFGVVHAAEAQVATASASLAENTPSLSPSDDPAEDTQPMTSSAEVDVLTSLKKRRAALDAQTADLTARENLLVATEKRVDEKIASLKALQDQISQLLGQRDTEDQKQLASLVKTYSTMKPKDAARIFNSLDDGVLVPVAHDMKSDALAPILAAMQPEAAQKLTVKLANRLKLPDPPPAPPTTPVAAAPDALTPIVPGATSAPAAAPGTTSSIQPVAPTTASAPAAAPATGKQAAAAPPPAAQAPHG
jgi:flagellar motility protein MotE (MotC chaperone)